MTVAFTDAEMAEERAEAEARMTLTVTIGVPGPWQFNPATGRSERTLTDAFTTRARIKPLSEQSSRGENVGDRTALSVDFILSIPWDSPEAPADAVARVTSVSALDDPTLLGAELALAGPAPGSQMTARRLLVREFLRRAIEDDGSES